MYVRFSGSVHMEPEQGKLRKEDFPLISSLCRVDKLEEAKYAGKAPKKLREIWEKSNLRENEVWEKQSEMRNRYLDA